MLNPNEEPSPRRPALGDAIQARPSADRRQDAEFTVVPPAIPDAPTVSFELSPLFDRDIFEKVPRLNGKDLATVQRLYKAEDLDFRLKQGSAAIDRGVELPTITDGFTGRAPDLGALELGKAPPIYGPRPK